MKHCLFFILLFACSLPLRAQVSETTAIRLYRVSDQIVRTEADGSNQASYPYENVYVRAANTLIQVTIANVGTYYYQPSLFLNEQGQPYGSTVNSAMNAYLLNIPASLSGQGSGTAVTTNASNLISGTLDDARLSANVVKTTGSYPNPSWISALDPSRITQNSLNRFVSDDEKTAWNQKPDLSQVRQVVRDSVRTYTFLNAAVSTNGTSTTVTIPTQSGPSVTVDAALNSSSNNPPANAAVTTAINQANANIAANTTAISSNSANITALQSQVATTANQVAANTADIASTTAATAANTAAINQANTNIAANTTAISSNSANITALQSQLATTVNQVAANTATTAANTASLNQATTTIAAHEAAIATNAANLSALQTQLTTGSIDDTRLSANVVKTTGSYPNPSWISALDPSRITQNSLNRFVSDDEKTAWNQKPDLSQVRQVVRDSVRTYTFLNAAVSTNGTSTTVTIPTQSGPSVTVDAALNSSSNNPPANAAVTTAINQANANIAANTTAISQANTNIAANTAAISQANANIAANTAAIATNSASLATLQSQNTSGPVDDSRLSANVVKTTGSYSNPGWISAFDASRITQTSLYRFVSDDEKTTWNQKPDLSQVRLAIRDSVRAITFVNATVTTNGNSTTVTIPSGGSADGSSITVDNALSTTSANPLTNSAITAAFAQVNSNVAANTTAITSNAAAISQTNANLANMTTTLNTATAGVASMSTNVTSLQTQLATAVAQVASLSALVGQLQQQLALSTGTFTIATPTLTASILSNSSVLLSWAASTNATSYTLESATNDTFTSNVAMLSVQSGTTFTATGLTAGVTYYFRVKASGGANTIASGYGTVSATISAAQPTLATPTNVVASATGSSTINISWTASPNATSYLVRYSLSSAMTSASTVTTSTPSASLTGLTAATSYFIDVSASASGYTSSANSAIATATTTNVTPTLAAPTNFVATPLSTSAIAASWTAPLNATSYTLRMSYSSEMTSATVITTSATSTTITNLPASSFYFMDLTASATGYNTSSAVTTTARTNDILPTLAVPGNVVATPLSTSTIAVSWTASANANSYTLRYSTSSDMSSPITGTVSSTSFTITGLTPSTTYYIDVSANAGFGYNPSGPSAAVTATTNAVPPTLPTPTNVVASPLSMSTIAVSWTGSTSATSYSVRYATTSAMTSATTLTTSSTSTTLTGLRASTAYFVDISASASGFISSATSAPVSATTNAAPVTLATPTGVSASALSTSAIVVSWTGSASATSYSVRYATNSAMTSATTLTTSATSTTITGLSAATSYFFDVSASASGFITSATSATATARTIGVLTVPTNVAASALGGSAIAVSWTAPANATSYTVRYAVNSDMSSPTSVTTSATSLTITGLSPQTQYFTDVSANASGFISSAASTPVSVTTTNAFVAERTFRLSFQTSSFGSATAGWNQIKPTTAQLTSSTATAYTSTTFVTEAGASSTLYLTLESPYSTASASSITATTGSVYPQSVMQSSWQVASTNTTGGRYSINGLTPGKYYHFYFLSATSSSNAVVSYTINGTVKTINAGNNTGVSGGSEFDPNKALVTFLNVQADATGKITILNKYSSGSASPFNSCVIRESSVMLP